MAEQNIFLLQYIDPNVEDENFYTEGTTSLVRFYLNLLLLIFICYVNKQITKCSIGQLKGRILQSILHKLNTSFKTVFNCIVCKYTHMYIILIVNCQSWFKSYDCDKTFKSKWNVKT